MNRHGGIRETGVLDYSVNINPLGMPGWMKEEILQLVEEANTYPPILAEIATQALSEHIQEPLKRLLLGNGATELLYLFARSIGPGRVLIVEPTFNEYRRAFGVAGWEVYAFLRGRDTWTLDVEELIDYLEKVPMDLVILCEPNNPTSTMTDSHSLEVLLTFCKEHDTQLFLDESFLDFTRQGLPAHSPGVVRLRSMTKFYSIAGLRLGYVLADEELVHKMIRFKEPWSVNTFAQGILPRLLDDEQYRRKSLAVIDEQRAFLYQGLQELGLPGPQPRSNFLFFRCEKEGFHQEMHKRGFYLRSCEDFYSLDDKYFRLCVRTEKDNRALLQAMKEVLR